MKDDRIILIFIIVNIVILTFVGACINTKLNKPKENNSTDKPSKVVTTTVKKCYRDVTQNELVQHQEVLINYSDDLIKKYSINYNIINSTNNSTDFNNQKEQVDNVISIYQVNSNVKISDYISDSDKYNVNIFFDLEKINEITIIPIIYNQSIVEGINVLKGIGYTCE